VTARTLHCKIVNACFLTEHFRDHETPHPTSSLGHLLPRGEGRYSLPSPVGRGCPDASGRVRGQFTNFGCGSPALRCPLLLLLLAVTAWGAVRTERHTPPASPNSAAQAALAKARERVLAAQPLAMFYYSDDSSGLESLQTHAGAMTVLSPQCYGLDRTGTLHGQLPPGVLEVTRRAGLPLMPLVTNPGFDRSTAHALLHNARAEELAAASLAKLAERDQYVGWQLDFEGIDPRDKLAYTRFVARVAARLHHDHRLLSVAVVPRFSDTFPASSPAGYYTGEWGAAFDFRGLGRVADFLVLMAYDQHTPQTPPGPVAGYDWVKAALDFAVARVSPARLVLGLPLYGREWVETSGGSTAHSIAYKDLNQFFDGPGSEAHWDDRCRTTWFQLREGDTLHTAWFDDARSLREKLKLVEAAHLRGYAAWRLGMEDPEFWKPEGQ